MIFSIWPIWANSRHTSIVSVKTDMTSLVFVGDDVITNIDHYITTCIPANCKWKIKLDTLN